MSRESSFSRGFGSKAGMISSLCLKRALKAVRAGKWRNFLLLVATKRSTRPAKMSRSSHTLLEHYPELVLRVRGTVNAPLTDIGAQIADRVSDRIYLFRAIRFNAGWVELGSSTRLAPDARNLAEVLSNFGQNSARYRRFNNLVREIFPHTHWITTRSYPQESGKVGVVLSPFDAELERPDLHVPLEHCGTGVAQVLAILYVVINSDPPQVIIIDEPQSFLHPGAARKLIQILKGHPEHQYVIATHSPAIISATRPERTFMLKLRDGETCVETMDATATAAQERCLLELGAKPSYGLKAPRRKLAFP